VGRLLKDIENDRKVRLKLEALEKAKNEIKNQMPSKDEIKKCYLNNVT